MATTRPSSAPGARAVAPADAAPDARWDLLLVCVAGYMMTSVGRVHQLFPILEIVHPAVLTGLVAIGLALSDTSPMRQWNRLFVPPSRYLLAFGAWMIVGIPFALSAGNSLDLVNGFVKTMVMYFVLAAAVRGIRDVERLVFVYLVAAAVYSVVITLQFKVDGEAWRLARLYYYDANDFATFAVTALPMGLYFVGAAHRPRVRVIASAALVVLTVGFVRSGSRGGLIALVAVGIFVVIRFTGIPLRWRVGAVVLVALVVVGTASERYWKQMSTIGDADYNMTEETGRLQIWQRGVGYLLDNPIFGVGVSNFGTAEGTLSPLAERQQYGIGVRWNAAHNMFVQVGAELGFPGLALFIAIIASTFVILRRRGRRGRRSAGPPPIETELTPVLTASLLGFTVGAFFLSLAYSEILYTLSALAVALHKVIAAEAGRRS